jgi:predicted DNA-binding protein YlxM (UPF0122 family)
MTCPDPRDPLVEQADLLETSINAVREAVNRCELLLDEIHEALRHATPKPEPARNSEAAR